MVKRVSRVKKDENDTGEISYRKLGGGSFIFRNQYIKPNQVFKARPEEIPIAFKDVVVPVNKDEAVEIEEETVKKEVVKTDYSLKHKEDGLYEIVDGNGKVISEKPMKEDEAKEVLKTL